RRMVSIGEVAQVVQYLGRHFSVAGKVVYGEQRGRTLGFPTANIDVDNELIPAEGVYAVKIRVGDNFYDAACNIGRNPTFNGKEVSVEVFIFDFNREIYGERVRVYFIERIRTDRKFESVDELKKAIDSDVVQCKRVLESARLVL
ncbi:MAG: riboflavin biosynthesis protein RibF, partial [Desulfuromonadales bacterium]|nr:riboflavin biosynthesis protein RibF [Desulfuromonadales bacterium]